MFKNERGMLKNSVLKADNWPISKSELVNKLNGLGKVKSLKQRVVKEHL
jgi:hypothetical protein